MKKLNEIFNTEYDVEIKDVKTSSREINKGDLFVCIQGFNVDRHDFVKQAEEVGAAALVVSKDVDSSLPQIKVDNTNEQLVPIVTKFYDYPSTKMTMIGVTGTDGKTTTASIIYQLLNHHVKSGYIGTNGVLCPSYEDESNNTTPTPEHLHRFLNNFYKEDCKATIIETASEGLAQNRCDAVEFDYSVFTNLTHEHLNYHKTMENYLKAKMVLFEQTKKDGYCIINIDDEYSEEIIKACNGTVITYGSNKDADFHFSDVIIEKTKTTFTLNYKNKSEKITIPLLGKFNVYNTTAALAILITMGYELSELKKHFDSLYIDGRMNSIELGQDFKVIIDYAHTPNGYLNLFELTKTLDANRTIIVAGLAGERDAAKRPIMGELLVNNADIVVFTYEDPRTEDPSDIIDQMIERVKDNKDKYLKIVDRKEAIQKAIDIAQKDDMILILGKGNETFQVLGRERIYFNDFEEAENALKNRLEREKKQ